MGAVARVVACLALPGSLAGCLASLPWLEGPLADASTPHVIYFDVDAYKIEEGYRLVLKAHARRMKNAPSLRLQIRAYTDRSGARDYNLALSRTRAEMVMKELVALGVPASRVESLSHGEGRGLSRHAHAHADQATDRRVELVYR